MMIMDLDSVVAIYKHYAVVGAIYNDDGGTSSGSAGTFSRSGSTWTEQKKVTASDS